LFNYGKAFCPGHVTGFFEICDSDPDPLKRGSRGAGFSTTLGAMSDAAVEPRDRQKITVVVHGLDGYAGGEVSILAVKRLIRDARLKVEVETDLQLPLSQGFGMSAAGALSATLSVVAAFGTELGLTRDDAIRAAHVAEVESKTGLGDVMGQAVGGFERRLEPGALPYGKVERAPLDDEVVLCVLGGALETKKVLTDPAERIKIIDAGRKAIKEYGSPQSLSKFCDVSWNFARSSGLATKEIEAAMVSVQAHGRGSMSMLGNSIFAFGDAEKLENELKRFGRTFRCRISPEGAKIL